MKTVAVLQSNYIPWKGYFDLIHDVDLFIFYDDVPYTRSDWRNRNRIKTPRGPRWLTIPVGSPRNRLICDVRLNDPSWQKNHWENIRQNYAKAPHFPRYDDLLTEIYHHKFWEHLSALNQHLIITISRELGIQTEFSDSRALSPVGQKQERLIDLLKKVQADRYISGPAGKAYLDEHRFSSEGIELRWKQYAGYREYPQFFPPFVHEVTILDLLFHAGKSAGQFIWGS
jgi:hypothetical protein